jgi:quercetin dioxygenase-like cupin family protein
MNYHKRLTILLALLFLTLGSSSVFGQAVPGPVVRHQFRAAAAPQPAPFNLVQSRIHFVPGAASPVHTHPGQVFTLVLEGSVTFRVQGTETTYKAGEGFIEQPNQEGQALNASAANTTLLVTFLIPKDAPLSRPLLGDTTPPPRNFVSYQFRTDAPPMTEPFDVAQQILDFEPGAATPYHTHPGIVMVTVVAGEMTFNLDGVDKVYKAGESFVEIPHQVAQARNAGTAPAQVIVSYLLPQGAPLSTPHAGSMTPVALPKTGAADTGALNVWQMLVATIGLIAGGWLLKRWRRRLG